MEVVVHSSAADSVENATQHVLATSGLLAGSANPRADRGIDEGEGPSAECVIA